MAQSPIAHASGLERDCRQDEFPIRQDEFPTRQDEFPTAYSPHGQTLHHGDPQVLPETKSNLPLHDLATKTDRRLCGLHRSTFLIVAVLLVVLVFTGIGMGVLGSRLKISEQKSNDSSNGLSLTAFPSSTITSPATSLATTSSPTSSSSPTQLPVVRQLATPDNDCEAVGPQYTLQFSPRSGGTVSAHFNVSCNTDFVGGDFMSFYSPSLTTCMHGCAMFNYWHTRSNSNLELNCSGVTYLAGDNLEGNCWLKPWGYISARTEKKNSSYAWLSHVI